MGNCTGYCNGCNEQGTKFDVNQIRSSIKDNDHMIHERFGNQNLKGNGFGDDDDYTND